MLRSYHHANRSILVVGCGRFGSCLASSLSQEGYDVRVMDKDANAFHRLDEGFGGFQMQGDACDLDTLKAGGIEDCDIVLVATNDDNVNCMIAQIANVIFHIDQVYLRLNDPGKEELLEGSGIQAIYPARLSVQEFERISNIHLQKVCSL